MIAKKLAYSPPLLVKRTKMVFPVEILNAAGKRAVCKQCSSCHGCR